MLTLARQHRTSADTQIYKAAFDQQQCEYSVRKNGFRSILNLTARDDEEVIAKTGKINVL